MLIWLGAASISTVLAKPNDKKNNVAVLFCNEAAPLDRVAVLRNYRRVLEKVQMFAWEDLKPKATGYFKIIEPILSRHGIPNDFKYIAVIESALSSNATSSKGAHGYWQFMPETALDMGLKIDGKNDERRDLVKSTHAACRYFKQLYEQLGSWTLVAAAYNAGPTRINQCIDRAQSMSFYDLKMRAETTNYLYRILAVKYLFKGSGSIVTAPSKQTKLDDDAPVFSTRILIRSPILPDETLITVQPQKKVFVAAINTKVINMSSTQKGQIWTFEVVVNSTIDGQNVEAGDRIYAEVASFDTQTQRLLLKASKCYSPRKHELYNLNLVAADSDLAGLCWPINTRNIGWRKG